MNFNAGTWPYTINDPTEERDRYHRVVLHEARIAAEHDAHHSASPARRTVVDRLRAAIGLAPAAPDTIACGAC